MKGRRERWGSGACLEVLLPRAPVGADHAHVLLRERLVPDAAPAHHEPVRAERRDGELAGVVGAVQVAVREADLRRGRGGGERGGGEERGEGHDHLRVALVLRSGQVDLYGQMRRDRHWMQADEPVVARCGTAKTAL